MKYIFYIFLFIPIFLLSSCNSCKKENKEAAGIKKIITPEIKKETLDTFNLLIKRYETALFKLDPANPREGLEKIKKDYMFFLDNDFNDPANVAQIRTFINDPALKETYKAVIKEYPDLSFFEKPLKKAILRYLTLMPEKKKPLVYTYISGFLYEKPAIFVDSVLIIGLDLYLGNNFKLYRQINIPSYTTKFFKKEYIVRDCMFSVGEGIIKAPEKNRTFLDLMIYRGKILYFTDLVLADSPDSIVIKYTSPQMEWSRQNEGNVWAFFIEKNLLFSTDHSVLTKFLAEGPFTAAFSKSSPARIGEFIGWQIVDAYMKRNPNLTFTDLLNEKESQKILNGSGYKPKK